MDGARPVRAARGTTLTARQWSTEAPLRMLMNNLDPEVAERPDDLVVYGGTGRAARRVEKRVEERPVGDRVGSVGHGLGLAVRARDRAGVEVVAADHDRSRQLARGDHLVELQSREVALLVAEPADARREALEVDRVAGLVEPAHQPRIVGEQRLDGLVGLADVLGVSRECDPAERSAPLGELRADVGGNETREGERPVEAGELRLGADRVAVVEDLRTGVLESHHRRDVLGHRAARPGGEALGVTGRLGLPVLERDAHGQVRQRVVGAGLVGDDVDGDLPRAVAQQHVAEDLGGVADDAHRQRLAGGLRRHHARERLVEVGRVLVEVAVLDAARSRSP